MWEYIWDATRTIQNKLKSSRELIDDSIVNYDDSPKI